MTNVCILGSLELPLQKVLRIAFFLLSPACDYHFDVDDALHLLSASIVYEVTVKEWGFFGTSRSLQHKASVASILVTVLQETRTLEVSDPRDRIYSLLGLVQWPHVDVPPSLAPDYTKAARDVFRDAARYMIEKGDVNLLGEVEPSASSDLPSWVPDWNKSVMDRVAGDGVQPEC